MAAITDEAICLRRLDYSETSQVLVVLTRHHGKQRLIAKGIKRASKGQTPVGVDLLECGQATFVPRSAGSEALVPLTEWKQQDHFGGMRIELSRIYAAQYAAEITNLLTEEGDPHPAVFDALIELLGHLSGEAAAPVQALVRFQVHLLREAGLVPQLDRCVSCGCPVSGRHGVFVSAWEGGVLCGDCEGPCVEKFRTNPAALQAVMLPLEAPGAAAGQAFDLLDYYITEATGRRPRLSELFRRASTSARSH
ncbi:MAG TPA: DNA repair protein RecO [Phycisphaerae bacterium]|nr:DNA repair protein RecO [Phycisphaerae bacterium]